MALVSYFLFCTISAYLTLAKTINITVDDQHGPFPALGLSKRIDFGEGWTSSGLDMCKASCQNPQNSTAFQKAMNQTWTRATYRKKDSQRKPQIATFMFTGTAVYVNVVRAKMSANGVAGNMELFFMLDGMISRMVDKVPHVAFLQTVFSQSSLEQGEHNLTIQNGDPNGTYNECMVFLDSIIYTTDDSLLSVSSINTMESTTPTPFRGIPPIASSESSRTSRVGIIVAGVLGTVAGIMLVMLFFLMIKRIRRRRSSPVSSIESPASSDTLRRNTLAPVPFLKALQFSPASVSNRDSSNSHSPRISPSNLQSRPTIQSVTSTRPPTYRTRDSQTSQPGR